MSQSLDVAAILVPHGEKSRLVTLPPTSRVDKHDPEGMFHILMVSSVEPLTRMFGSSGLKATQFTPDLLKHTKLVLKTR